MAPKVDRAPTTPTVGIDVVSRPKMSRVDVSSGSRQIAQGVDQLGQAVGSIQTRIATTDAEDAMVNFERDKNNIFFGDGKAGTGYFNTQGVNAVDGAEPANASLDDLAKQYSEGLTNSQARNLFDNAVKVRMNRDKLSITKHAASGQLAYESSVLSAKQENSIENSALYWSNPDELLISRMTGRQAVIDQADLEGTGAEAKAERLQTFESKFASGAINAAIDTGDLGTADLLMEQFEDSLEGPDKVKIDAKFKVTKDKQTVALKVNDIYDPDKTLAEMTAESRAIKAEDPEIGKEVERQVTNQYKADQFAEKEVTSAVYNDNALQIETGELIYAEIPVDELERMTPTQREKLKKIESDVVSGAKISTDWVTYGELLTLPKDELANIDPADYYDVLAKGERQKLITAVKAAKNGQESPEFSTGRSRGTAITATTNQILGKKSASKYSTSDREFANKFNQLLSEEIQSAEETKKGKLTPAEFEGLLNSFTAKVVTDEGFFFDTEQDIADVPADKIDIVSSKLRENGYPVTSKNMVLIYNRMKERGNFDE